MRETNREPAMQMGAGRHAVSRRTTVRITTGGLGLALAARALGTAAQESGTPEPADLPAVIRAWIEAYNSRDNAAMAALYAPDGAYEDVPNNFIARGEEIPAFLAMGEQGLGDVRLEITHGFGTSTGAVIEYLFHATNRGLIPIPGTEGKSFTSRAVTIFELDGDMIRRSSDYYDLVAILTQIGALPPMAPGATPPATPDQ